MLRDRPFIQTVLGAVEPAELGRTLMHEHLAWDYVAGSGIEPPSESPLWMPRILRCVAAARDAGISAIVDVTPLVGAPSPLLIQDVARRSGMHIVYAIGFYTQEVHPYPAWVYPPHGTPESIADRMVEAAKLGLQGSGVKPGVIKVATSGRAISVIEETVLRGAALAQQRIGLLITTHTELSQFAAQQVEILADAGADLDRVVIGHMGWTKGVADIPEFCALADTGVTLGFDMIGMPVSCTTDGFAEIAHALVEAGHGDRVVFSHDQTAYCWGFAQADYEAQWYSGDFTKVSKELVPALIRRGMSDQDIDRFLVENPRRLLAVDPGRYPPAAETLLWEPDAQDVSVLGDYAVVSGLAQQ